MGKLLDRWREKNDWSDAEKELAYGVLLKSADRKLQQEESRGPQMAAMVSAGFGKAAPLLSLTQEEKTEALAWVMNVLGDSLEHQILRAILLHQPVYTIPQYHLYVAEDRRKREESARNRQISDDWENLAKNGFTFDADGFKVQLDAEDAKLEPQENFNIKGILADGRSSIVKLDFKGLRDWSDLVRTEVNRVMAEHGIEPKFLTVPLNIAFFFAAGSGRRVSLGDLGTEVRVTPECTVPLTLRCTRK